MIHKSIPDTNNYRSLHLNNGIDVLLVNNNKFTTSSCALSVNIGSFNEPPKYPGLAHFLEHMLFMGTEEYPVENAFDNFLNLYNGYSNAFTASEMTVYYCCIDSTEIETMAKMFASFFTCPLFNSDSIDREINAVDSEFLNSLNSDWVRSDALLSEFVKEGENRGRFNWGNNETLRQDGILEEVVEFWKNNYSSDLMKLVICSNKSFEEMEKLAHLFSNIKNLNKLTSLNNLENDSLDSLANNLENNSLNSLANNLDNNSLNSLTNNLEIRNMDVYNIDMNRVNLNNAFNLFFPDIIKNSNVDKILSKNFNDYCIFDEKYYKNIVKMMPLGDKKELLIFFNIPSMLGLFKPNPLGYISFIFTKTESDGLLAKLKNKGLAFNLNFEFEHYIGFTRIRLSAELTLKGCEHYKDVISVIHTYLKNIKANENDYLRIKRIEEEEFMLKPNEEPIELAQVLAESMQMYPIENIIDHDYVFEYFDEKLINNTVAKISDSSKWIIVLLDNNGTYTKKEKYFNVEYEIIDRYEDAPILMHENSCKDECKDRYKDEYLNNINCVNADQEKVKFESFEFGKITYIFNKSFNTPKAEIFIRLRSEKIKELFVNLQMFFELVEDAFIEEYSRDFYNFHLEMTTSVTYDGILIRFKGVNQRIAQMCKKFLTFLQNSDLSKFKNRFLLFKKQREDVYSKKMTSAPYRRLLEVFINELPGFDSVEKCSTILQSLTEDDIFLINEFYVEIIAVGNIEYNEIRSIYDCFNGSAKNIISVPKEITKLSFKTNDEFNNGVSLLYETCSFENYIPENENADRLLSFVDSEDNDSNLSNSDDLSDSNTTNENIFNEDTIIENITNELSNNEKIIKDFVIGRLIHQISKDDFYNQLRTTEQLGYCVSVQTLSTSRKEYLSFMVQSEKTVQFLVDRISKFISDLKSTISDMSEDELLVHKESVISFFEEPLMNMDDLSGYIFNQYCSSGVDISFKYKVINMIRRINKKDIINSRVLDKKYCLVSSYN